MDDGKAAQSVAAIAGIDCGHIKSVTSQGCKMTRPSKSSSSKQNSSEIGSSENLSSLPLGLACMAVGFVPIAAALGWIQSSNSSQDAPTWVLMVCGLVFQVSGLMLIAGDNKRLVDALAAIFMALMGAMAAWVTLAPAEGLSGGIPFIPRALNVAIARCLFGSGALICFWMCKYAIQQAIRGDRT